MPKSAAKRGAEEGRQSGIAPRAKMNLVSRQSYVAEVIKAQGQEQFLVLGSVGPRVNFKCWQESSLFGQRFQILFTRPNLAQPST